MKGGFDGMKASWHYIFFCTLLIAAFGLLSCRSPDPKPIPPPDQQYSGANSSKGKLLSEDEIGNSSEGKPIVAYILTPQLTETARKTAVARPDVILFLAVMNGDEPEGEKLLFQLQKNFLERYQAKIPNKKVVLIPVVNPDGLEQRSSESSERVNINHDFSEKKRPETVGIINAIEKYQPARVISIRSFNQIDFDGPDEQEARRLAEHIKKYTPRLDIDDLGIDRERGSLGWYCQEIKKIPLITFGIDPILVKYVNDTIWALYGRSMLAAIYYPEDIPAEVENLLPPKRPVVWDWNNDSTYTQKKCLKIYEEGNWNNAKNCFVDELRLNPKCADCRDYIDRCDLNLLLEDGRVALDAGDKTGAINTLLVVVEREPQNKEARQLLSKAHFEIGDNAIHAEEYKKAIAHFKAALEYNKDCTDCAEGIAKAKNGFLEHYYNIGLVHFKSGKSKSASDARRESAALDFIRCITAWKDVIEMEPGYKDVSAGLAEAEKLALELNYEIGLAYFGEAGERAGRYFKENDENGRRGALKSYDKCIEAWRRVERIDPAYKDIENKIKIAEEYRLKLLG